MDIEPRPLNSDERSVLDLLLSVEFEGAVELREQATKAMVVGRCDCGCPSVDLAATPSASVASISRRLAPVEGQVAPIGDEPPGNIILFLDKGRLSYLEYVYFGDNVPSSWPTKDRVATLKIER